jgi:hypothetical protein
VSPRSLVGSYPTVSPLPAASPENTPSAVCFLCHFPSAFAASLNESVLPFGVRTFLEHRLRDDRGHPACDPNSTWMAQHSFPFPAAPSNFAGVRTLAAVIVALALAGPAGAWTRLTPDTLQNIVKPKVLTTSSGTQLVAYYEDKTGSLKVVRDGAAVTVVSGYLSVAEPALVQLPNGTVLLYATGTTPGFGTQGILRFSSSDDGKTWTSPVRAGRSDLGEVMAATVLPDGTPMFVNYYGTLRLYRGLNGEVVQELSTGGCCSYAHSLVVDSKGLAEVAVYSNANPPNSGFLFGVLDATGALVGSWQNLSGGKETTPHNDRVPLAVDTAGNTFVAWAEGYPSAKAVVVQTLRAGAPAHAVRLVGSFTGGDPHMALAVDASNRVWAVWTRGGALWAARSRSAGSHFGAAVRSPIPSGATAYQVSALATTGGVTGFVNLGGAGGSGLWSQQLLPGLTVVFAKGGLKVLDDGFPIAGAVVTGGGKTARTGANGTTLLKSFKKHVLVSVTAAGYASTSFRVP